MSTLSLHERDRQLVELLRHDKAAFLQEYRRVMLLPADAHLSGVLDREMIRAVLDKEYPQLRVAQTAT